jgi:hypothetical protein
MKVMEKGKATPTADVARTAEAPNRDRKASLRGKSFAEQEQALKPDAGGGKKGPAEKASGPQPAPHALPGLGAGKFNLFVEGQSAHFHQRVRVDGALADLPKDAAPAVGAPVAVDAKGPWSVRVEHKVPDGTEWAKDRPKGWSASTHQELQRSTDTLDIGTEDFKDNDFDDLVLSVVRADASDDGGAYVVESETQVEGGATRHDLILGAAASGRLDVVLDARIISPAELAGLDPKALGAMAERFTGLRGQLAASVDHAPARKAIEAEIARWERAIAEARVKAEVAKPAA